MVAPSTCTHLIPCMCSTGEAGTIVALIEERIAEWTHLPRSHGEPIEVLRYTDGQKYEAHW